VRSGRNDSKCYWPKTNGEERVGVLEVGMSIVAVGGKLGMEIRPFEVNDAAALWRLRMTALHTDPWSFAESVEELRQISVEEYGRRIGGGLGRGATGILSLGRLRGNAGWGCAAFIATH